MFQNYWVKTVPTEIQKQTKSTVHTVLNQENKCK